MNFLNLGNSLALCVFLFFLQLSIIHPVSGRNLVSIQRVTRNDQNQDYHHEPENQALDVIPTTSEPFVAINDEILTAVEQETVDSSTGSPVTPVIENDVNAFILVASDGQFADEPVTHPVEIVTPSFLDMDVGAIPDESEPTVKQEDYSVNHQIVAEPFYNNLANSPTEVPENQAQLSPDAASVDPAVFVPENSPVVTDVLDVSAPVSDESEPIQKIKDLSVNPIVFEVPVSDESAASIAENPFVEPVVISAPISDEVEPAQKLEDPSVIPLVADVPITDEAAIVAEEPSADPAVASVPVSNESESVQKLEDPVVDPLVADVPFSDEVVAPIAEHPSGDPEVASAPIPAEVESAQKLEDPTRPAVSPTKPQVQYKYQPITSTSPSIGAYGPPRITTNPQSSYKKNSFPTRPFGSSPKPRQLGFPPIASTRDNVLLEVNWAGKLGRPYRQAKLH